MSYNKRFLSQPKLARRWGLSVRTLQARAQKRPHMLPVFIRLNGRKAFDLDDVEAFEAAAASATEYQKEGPLPCQAATQKNIEALNSTDKCIANISPIGKAKGFSCTKGNR